MATVGRWIGRILAGLVVLVACALAIAWIVSVRVLGRTYERPAVTLTIPTDSGAIARGEHLARLSCFGCHGDSLTGTVMFDVPIVARIVSPNVGTMLGRYTDAQLASLMRYGVRPDGTSPLLMPPMGFYHMSDTDLAALIGFLRSLHIPASPTPLPTTRIGPMGRIGLATGQFNTAAMVIDPTIPRVGADTASAGSRQGEYLARMICAECHGAALTGGAGGPAPAPSLAQAHAYSLAEFTALMHEGQPRDPATKLPNMSEVAKVNLVHLTDEEVGALHAYLQQLPIGGVPAGR